LLTWKKHYLATPQVLIQTHSEKANRSALFPVKHAHLQAPMKSSKMTTSYEKNILHALDAAAAIDEHRKELFGKGELTQADDQMLTAQLQEVQQKFHEIRSRNFEFVKAEERNLKSMSEKRGGAASIEAGATELKEGNRWCTWCWSCFYM
jgi:hypothetical protein